MVTLPREIIQILIIVRYTILNTCEQRWFDRMRGGSAPQNKHGETSQRFFATDFRVSPRKICGKCCGATLSGRTIFLSIDTRFRVRGLFLPHIMAGDTWQPHQGKKGKNDHATLCGRTVCTLGLCLQRLRGDSCHIIWRESAMI